MLTIIIALASAGIGLIFLGYIIVVISDHCCDSYVGEDIGRSIGIIGILALVAGIVMTIVLPLESGCRESNSCVSHRIECAEKTMPQVVTTQNGVKIEVSTSGPGCNNCAVTVKVVP
jgi:hypothetical protein